MGDEGEKVAQQVAAQFDREGQNNLSPSDVNRLEDLIAAALRQVERETWKQAATHITGSKPIAHGNTFRAIREHCDGLAQRFLRQAKEGA